MFDRALRRAGIDVNYSEGFNPHPKISFGPPLAVGIEGEREYADLDIRENAEISGEELLNEVVCKLKDQLPPGIRITGWKIRPEGSKALMAVINLARYKVTLHPKEGIIPGVVTEACRRWLSRDEVITVRWNKSGKSEKNIRSWVKRIEVLKEEEKEPIILRMDIVTGNEGSVRPGEILDSLSQLENLPIDRDEIQVIREGLYVYKDGNLLDPLNL
jgi:radical SAM-linked protein